MATGATFPAVYVEELPSGVRSIQGAPTAITAFVGRTQRGPVQTPVPLRSFAEFERVFGGLWEASTLPFAVQQFFANGGTEAVVVRLHRGAIAGTVQVPLEGGGTAGFIAASPGRWAAGLRIRIDHAVPAAAQAAQPPGTLFNLAVKDLGTGLVEEHRQLSTRSDDPRFVGTALQQASALLRGPAASLPSRPAASAPPQPAAADPFDDPGALQLDVPATADGQDIGAQELHAAPGLRAAQGGVYALDAIELFNLLVVPPYAPGTDLARADWDALAAYAGERRALLLVDPPAAWASAAAARQPGAVEAVAPRSANAALYFPRLLVANPLRGGQLQAMAPSGAVAGVMARTDASRGVWKAPAGTEAVLSGVQGPSLVLTQDDMATLTPLAVNCLRQEPGRGLVVWGARTLAGSDALASEWRSIPVRRLALFVLQSLERGLQWTVFEPNAEPLWAQVRLAVESFLQGLFRQGAFQGQTPQVAYFVRCDASTTTAGDVAQGVVRLQVGFAALKPAEFVVLQLRARSALPSEGATA